MTPTLDIRNFVRTKIVATVGPACSSPEMLQHLIHDGVNVFRINMAHGDRDEHERVLSDIRRVSAAMGTPVAVLIDLAGPKIRLGQLAEDPLVCALGNEFTFVRGDQAESGGELTCNYQHLIDDANMHDQILLGDGIVRLEVVAKSAERLQCRVVDGGEIRSRQGIALPGVQLRLPALTPQDLDNAAWAAQRNVDFISLSFVRKAVEVQQLRSLVREHDCQAAIISKIEKREALDNLDEIIAASDAVMVARGDLGVDIPIESTPLAQKRIIRRCRETFRPVIVATQMLDSMHHSKSPTRAEVSDVANAILDGADACMLSGETAIGEYPRSAVGMMRRIIAQTETLLKDRPPMIRSAEHLDSRNDVTRAVVFGAAHIADRIDAKLMVIGTCSGDAARMKSKLRDSVPTIGVAQAPRVLGQLCLYWGILPLAVENVDTSDVRDLHALVNRLAGPASGLTAGNRVVFVADSEILPGVHDMVTVGEIRQ